MNTSGTPAWALLGCLLTASLGAQVPVSFQVPKLGYVFDAKNLNIRPIAGILGNARIVAPLPIPLELRQVVFLPDQRTAIVAANHPEVLVLDLETTGHVPIAGAPSSVSTIALSANGAVAALDEPATGKIRIITGLPETPVVRTTIDVPFAVSRLAVSNDGKAVLAAFSSADHDVVYRWTTDEGLRFLIKTIRIADLTFVGEHAVLIDSSANEVLWVADVLNAAVPSVVADFTDGISQPEAISVLSTNEIYIGSASGTIVVLDAAGRVLRKLSCGCPLSTMTPLGGSALRLTGQLDRPLFVLDRSGVTERFLFIPALQGITP